MTVFRTAALAVVASLALSFPCVADDKKPDMQPRVVAFAPLEATPGSAVLLRVRGVKLENVNEIHFPGAQQAIRAEIKEKKKAEVPNGLDAKEIGDAQVEVAFTLPADAALGPLAFSLAAPEGSTAPRVLRVIAADSVVEEKEPNNGFWEAQPLEFDKVLCGGIREDKDVDVFRLKGRARQKICAEIIANGRGSLLDAALTLFDAHGNILCAQDDAAGARDPRLIAVLPSDGDYFLSVQDANDRGGPWYAYELVVTEVSQ